MEKEKKIALLNMVNLEFSYNETTDDGFHIII